MPSKRQLTNSHATLSWDMLAITPNEMILLMNRATPLLRFRILSAHANVKPSKSSFLPSTDCSSHVSATETTFVYMESICTPISDRLLRKLRAFEQKIQRPLKRLRVAPYVASTSLSVEASKTVLRALSPPPNLSFSSFQPLVSLYGPR